MDLKTWGDIGIIYCAVVFTAATIIYGFSPWHKDEVGKHLIFFMAAFSITFDLAAVNIIFSPPWFLTARVIAFLLLIPLASTWRLYLIVTSALDYRRNLKNERTRSRSEYFEDSSPSRLRSTDFTSSTSEDRTPD